MPCLHRFCETRRLLIRVRAILRHETRSCHCGCSGTPSSEMPIEVRADDCSIYRRAAVGDYTCRSSHDRGWMVQRGREPRSNHAPIPTRCHVHRVGQTHWLDTCQLGLSCHHYWPRRDQIDCPNGKLLWIQPAQRTPIPFRSAGGSPCRFGA